MSKMTETDFIMTMHFDKIDFFILYPNPSYSTKVDRSKASTYLVFQDLKISHMDDIQDSLIMLPTSNMR